MKRKHYDTVTEAMADLKKLGYTLDFSIMAEEERLVSSSPAMVLSPDDFEIDSFYRFEGPTDPGDQMIVYAISSKNSNLKGIVVNAYGIYADNASSAIVKKLNAHPEDVSSDIIDNITRYFVNEENIHEASSPEGTCPACWGYQEYDGKIRTLFKDKQIDVNNHKANYSIIQEFMKHNIEGISLIKGEVTDCPNCPDEKSS